MKIIDKKRYILATAFMMLLLNINAQYFDNNILQYWYYRNRLTTYFTSVGSEQGQSLIISERNIEFISDNKTGSKKIGFGETPINLGHYIGILATEYKLLSDNGQDVSQTAKELYYAINAYSRLDFIAESFYPGHTPSLNGFFMRRDVPQDLIEKHPDLNKNLSLPAPNMPFVPYEFGSGKPQWIDEVFDHIGKGVNPMSLDQISGILMGFALVSKLVPPDDGYNGLHFISGSGNSTFVAEVKYLTGKIIHYLKDNNWLIKDPNGNLVNAGPDVRFLAYAYAKAAANIVGHHLTTSGFSDLTVISSEPIWQALQVATFASPDFCVFYTTLDPEIKTFLSIVSPLTGYANLIDVGFCNYYNMSIMLRLAAIGNSWNNYALNTTQEAIIAHGSFYRWGAFYTLLWDILNNPIEPFLFPNNNIEDILSSAPCDGPFFHNANDKAPNGWASENRFTNNIDEQENGPPFNKSAANYSGLDYMLLHNMYYIHRMMKNGKDSKGNPLPFYENLMERYVGLDFPFPFPNIGSQSKPVEVDAFKKITADNTIKADASGNPDKTGNVTYRAGEEIILLAGFEVEAGAEFLAYIDDFECAGNAYARTDNSDTTSENLLYGFHDSFLFQENNYIPLAQNEPIASVTDRTQKESRENMSLTNYQYKVVPNPTTGKFTIVGSSELGLGSVYVYNNIGQIILSQTLPFGEGQGGVIDITNQPAGIYFVRIFSPSPAGEGQGEVFLQKVVKE